MLSARFMEPTLCTLLGLLVSQSPEPSLPIEELKEDYYVKYP